MQKCKYSKGCDEDVFEKGYCILHVELPEDEESSDFKRINELKKKKVQEKIHNNDFNFEGARLFRLKLKDKYVSSDFDLTDSKIKKDLIFENCTFERRIHLNLMKIKGNLIFDSSEINGNINLESSVIEGKFRIRSVSKRTSINNNLSMAFVTINKGLIFKDADIKGKVTFESAVNLGDISFISTNIQGELSFYGAKKISRIEFKGKNSSIKDNLSLEYAEIQGDVDLESMTINGKFDCDSVKIVGNANFKNLEVKKGLYLENAIFDGELNLESARIGTGNIPLIERTVSFEEAEITGNANFIRTDFMSRASFVGSHFKENAFFTKAKFFDFTNFNGVKFFENVDFDQTTFKEKVDFSKASFLEVGLFSEISISNNSNFIASFEDARLKNVAFRDCDLTYVKFKHVILENCELSTSNWNDKILEQKDYEENKSLMRAFKAIKNVTFRGESTGYKDSLGRCCKFIKRFLKELWAPSQFKKAEIAGDTYRRLKQCLQNEGSYNKAGKFYINEMNMKKEVYRSKNKKSWLFYIFLSITSGYGEKLTPIFTIFTFYWIIYVSAVYFMPNNKLVIPVGSGILSILTALFVYVFARKMAR